MSDTYIGRRPQTEAEVSAEQTAELTAEQMEGQLIAHLVERARAKGVKLSGPEGLLG